VEITVKFLVTSVARNVHERINAKQNNKGAAVVLRSIVYHIKSFCKCMIQMRYKYLSYCYNGKPNYD